ncbi:glycoside hydrolase family 2 protein [Chitinophaga filiformis]|uniref:Glycosyl hydrolases family 2, TIM barrel domain n=1 Tax=Chitinophaga filiformis TaxID=104663 RepID=A0A1G7WKW2_CHIFI|nr:sugar-binding domain-containing protein [Chitinophaga filiformis]SDG72514.1 Glycosyl hydrolases family 2, TIM barrel domain [Chitinophaga filiformis]
MNLSKTASVCFLSVVLGQGLMAQTNWQIQPIAIKTRWAKEVSPTNALPEYPRPQMVRENWQNLNGLWNYTITPKDATTPSGYQGQILVPYPLESALSGVKKPLQPSENLWYKRAFTKPALKDGEHVLLHFGAVDWQATVYVNGKETGSHSGGYQAFSQDITAALKDGENEIVVKVFDPTSEGIGPHGKQVLNPANIYYTPTSGIWQTVWLETVPADYIAGLDMTPDIDKGILNVKVNAPAGTNVELIASDGGTEVSKIKGKAGAALKLPVKNAKLWSPANPFLYDLTVKLTKGGKTIDQVKSYFGMRKIAIQKDEKGVDRIFLNNHAYFNLGTLDQGFWPDGLYTAPTDNALKFDIEAIKAMGFNTIRKHIKVEPARWYYHADKLGMLVWQDFVNPNQGLPEGAKAEYEKETKETLEQLHNHPAITTWVIFNEKWGAFDQQRITEWVKASDPSRIVNGHSGEMLYVNEQLRSPSPNAWVSADMTDVHSYPDPMNAPAEPGKARVLGEFGGIGVFIPDHQWNTSSAWGYIQEKAAGLATKYTIMNQHLQLLEAEGLSGSIYTQPFDVEGEQNGLLTYDREVIKIPFEQMRKIHSPLNPDLGAIPAVTAKNADLTDPGEVYSKMLQDYINGRRDPEFLFKMAMMAQQAGDKNGANMAGGAYITTLQAPYTPEQLALILQFTSSTKDKGFSVLQEQLQSQNSKLEKRPVTVKLMNIVFRDVIDPVLQKSGDTPDWNAIANSVKPYGDPGEEIFLRAKTVYTFNKQDWTNYASVANTYLEKYGQNIPEQERNMFQQAINNSKNQ